MGEKKDAEEVREILEVVSEKVPKLLNDLADVLYGKDRAEQYAKAVATFYKELKSAGMDDKMAFELTKQYMSPMNISKIIGGKGGMGGHGGPDLSGVPDGDELARKINIKIKKKMKEKGLDVDEDEDDDDKDDD